jgi:hypothetical protein
MSFLDRIKSLFSGGSQRDDDHGHHQLQSPTNPEPSARQPTEAEIEAAAAAAPPVAPVDPHPTQGEPTVEPGGVPRYEGVDGADEGEPVDEREDPAP